MKRSESITNLAAALARAQAEMPVAAFDATNPFLKSKYASLGSVIQASRPILAKHKLSLVQFPISEKAKPGWGNPLPSDGRVAVPASRTNGTDGTNAIAARGDARPIGHYIGVETILTHESGEFIAERILLPLAEEKGKTKVQCAGSTLTYLRRYSWAAILGMYSDEDSDGSSPVQAFAPRGVPVLPPPPMKPFQNN